MQPKDPTFTRSDPWKFDTRFSPNQLRTLPIKSKARTVQSVHPKRILETSNLFLLSPFQLVLTSCSYSLHLLFMSLSVLSGIRTIFDRYSRTIINSAVGDRTVIWAVLSWRRTYHISTFLLRGLLWLLLKMYHHLGLRNELKRLSKMIQAWVKFLKLSKKNGWRVWNEHNGFVQRE
jgi:hypothetical protein